MTVLEYIYLHIKNITQIAHYNIHSLKYMELLSVNKHYVIL